MHHNNTEDVSRIETMLDALGSHERASTPESLLSAIKTVHSPDQKQVLAHIDDVRTKHTRSRAWVRPLGFAVAAMVLVGVSIPVLLQMKPTIPTGPDTETQLAAYEQDYEFVFAMLDDLDNGLSSSIDETRRSYDTNTDPADALSLLDLWETGESTDEETMG